MYQKMHDFYADPVTFFQYYMKLCLSCVIYFTVGKHLGMIYNYFVTVQSQAELIEKMRKILVF